MHLLDEVHLSDSLQRLSDLTVSREALELLIFQLAAILAAFLLAWGFRAATRSWSDRLAQRVATQFRALRFPAGLHHRAGRKGVFPPIWAKTGERTLSCRRKAMGIRIVRRAG